MCRTRTAASAGIVFAGLVCASACRAAPPVPVAKDEAAVNTPRPFRVIFSGDGSYLISGGDAIRVFRVETGELVQRVALKQSSNTLSAFSGRGGTFADANEDGIVRIRRVSAPQPLRELKGHTGAGRQIAISPDGRLIASVAGVLENGRWARSEIRLWDAAIGRVLHELEFGEGGVNCVAFSRDGKQLALAMNRQAAALTRIDFYDVTSWKRVRSVTFSPGFASSICFNGDTGELLIIGGDCPRVNNGCQPTGRVWIAEQGAENAREIKQDRAYSYFMGSLTPAADRFVIGTSIETATVNAKGKVDGARMGPLVQLRDAKTGDVLWSTLTTGAGDPGGIAVSPDGKLVAALIEETIHLFVAETGEPVRQIRVEK